MSPLAPGGEGAAVGRHRLQVHPRSSAAQNQRRGCTPQRDETHPNGPEETFSPGIALASCCAFKIPLRSLAGQGTLPGGISGARCPTVMVVIIPEEQTYQGGDFARWQRGWRTMGRQVMVA